jgi:hypothetical protein
MLTTLAAHSEQLLRSAKDTNGEGLKELVDQGKEDFESLTVLINVLIERVNLSHCLQLTSAG